MEDMTGARLVAEAIQAKGIRKIFTLSGGHITPIYQYLEGSDVTLVDTRHEQAAVYMAEAWARMTRKPALAMVTAGPGFTNALSAVANARMANSPVILVSGCVGVDCAEKLDLQDIRQAPIIEPMVKRALVCQKPERAYEFFDLAYRTAAAGRPGPVYLELPVDVLNASVAADAVRRPDTRSDSRPVDLANAVRAVDMLAESDKPLIIAGSGTWYADGAGELTRFVEQTGIPVVTGSLGRGTVPDPHPLCFESSLAIRPGAALMGNMSADTIFMLGNRVSLYYIFGDLFNASAKLIQVDIAPEEMGRNRTVDLPVVSDIRAFLAECNRIVESRGMGAVLQDRFSGWVSEWRQWETDGKAQAAGDRHSDRVPIHPMRLAHEVDAFLDRDDDIVVADGGDTQVWMGMTRTVRSPGHYFDSGIYGCLGVGLPYANAAQLRYPDKRVCLITGDGSIGFNFMEFETAVRKRLPIVVVISNDLGWGMIRHSQELRLGHAIDAGTYIGRVDYHKLVAALGGAGLFVDKPADIRPALEEAFAARRTACINVMTDPTTVSPGSVALANLGGYKAT